MWRAVSPLPGTSRMEQLVESIAERVVNLVLDAIDINAIVGQVDMDALLTKVDIDAIVSKVDVDSLIDRVDVQKIIDAGPQQAGNWSAEKRSLENQLDFLS